MYEGEQAWERETVGASLTYSAPLPLPPPHTNKWFGLSALLRAYAAQSVFAVPSRVHARACPHAMESICRARYAQTDQRLRWGWPPSRKQTETHTHTQQKEEKQRTGSKRKRDPRRGAARHTPHTAVETKKATTAKKEKQKKRRERRGRGGGNKAANRKRLLTRRRRGRQKAKVERGATESTKASAQGGGGEAHRCTRSGSLVDIKTLCNDAKNADGSCTRKQQKENTEERERREGRGRELKAAA